MESTDLADVAPMTAQARFVEAHEQARWLRRLTSVADLLLYLIDQHGLSGQDLVPTLGTQSQLSEMLHGKRADPKCVNGAQAP
jgi:HTH-type transcriptional regulator/antitoxin HigA